MTNKNFIGPRKLITTIAGLRKALKGSDPLFTGIVLYEGKSLLDGAPVVAIANRIMVASGNAKTGAMVQTFIIRSDIHPVEALETGADASICGSCIHRPKRNGAGYLGDCYVQVGKSVASVYGAYQRGRYARPGVDFAANLLPLLFEGLLFRIGSYGDPAAIPYQVWRGATMLAAGVNGYTHQWQDPRFAMLKTLCMASADSTAEMDKAHAAGWRTFRVRASNEPLIRGREVICPASAEAGHKTSCADCKACGGLSAKAKVSIVIMAHGAKVARVAA
jgi:hypothetical protein